MGPQKIYTIGHDCSAVVLIWSVEESQDRCSRSDNKQLMYPVHCVTMPMVASNLECPQY